MSEQSNERSNDGYAQAIVDVARAEGVLEEVEEELFRFARTLDANPDLVQGMADPRLPAQQREAMITELLSGKVLPQTVSLLGFVVASGKGRQVEAIVGRVLDIAAADRSQVVAEVRTAVSLDAAQKDRLAAALSRATGRAVEVRAAVDPSVIGGVWAQVGDQVIDGTVRNRLDRFRDGLRAG